MENERSDLIRTSRTCSIRSVFEGKWQDLRNEHGEPLRGIRGLAGVAARTKGGMELGIDLIEMQPGAAFAVHTHQGDHILLIMEGRGTVNIDDNKYGVVPGDTVFIPAELPHNVTAFGSSQTMLRFVAIGHPHKALVASDRMQVVT